MRLTSRSHAGRCWGTPGLETLLALRHRMAGAIHLGRIRFSAMQLAEAQGPATGSNLAPASPQAEEVKTRGEGQGRDNHAENPG